jgi:hypothetical protein
MDSRSIKDQISSAYQNIYSFRDKITEMEDLIDELKDTALNVCDHDISKPVEGYEHEGGTCIKCGLNEIYIAVNRRK